MSYILDALRRADAERERGAVPGIYAQPVPVPSAEDLPRRGAPTPWLWVALGLAVALFGVLAWWWLAAPAPAPAAQAPVATVPPPPIPAAPEPSPAPAPVAALPAPIERRPTTSEAALAERKAAAASAAGASAPATADRVVARADLPEEIRRQLPQLTVSGSMFSPNPASRFVVINGQVLHEKDELGPDHVLVQIKLRAAVLRFKNHLYEITF